MELQDAVCKMLGLDTFDPETVRSKAGVHSGSFRWLFTSRLYGKSRIGAFTMRVENAETMPQTDFSVRFYTPDNK